ncbi:hypothetical protein KY284_023098 [Solanum tuberosum]|nr:hypothetical protein KY284_023098 [Solanum tuberosum]
MRIQLLGKNELGLVDDTLSMDKFDKELSHQWNRCNAIIVGWIMSSVANELLTGILYAKDARVVWEDLREHFDKVNASRVYQLHKGITTITQGSKNILTYFSKLRDLWVKFGSMVPNPCDCPRSKDFIAHMESQKLMQFLMGLSESYDQARSQILMTSPTPSINKASSMLIERESQRTMASTSMVGQGTEVDALLAGKGDGYQKPQRN